MSYFTELLEKFDPDEYLEGPDDAEAIRRRQKVIDDLMKEIYNWVEFDVKSIDAVKAVFYGLSMAYTVDRRRVLDCLEWSSDNYKNDV